MSLNAVTQISSKLWENLSVIDEFIESNRERINNKEIALVSSWRKVIHGKFIIDRHLKKGSVQISLEDEEVYIVKGLYSGWKELLEDLPMPHVVQATLPPFRNVITHNGIVGPYGMCLSGNIKHMFN